MKHPIVRRCAGAALVSLAFAFGGAGAARAAGAGIFQARTWDQPITLPAGPYRAAKPIALMGNHAFKVEPGALVEGVNFEGKNDPHWAVDGALLRRTRIVGELGVSLSGKDSAFDECTMHRVGGWFVSWWGSRWKFENCVFSKTFLIPNIDVGNYAVRATRCTFVGVKMPNIGHKEDPAAYLQGDELRFEKCKFVQCEIPETLLAATVNCVFESCQFPSKKADWKGAKRPIKVTATIPGGGRVPPSYLNGPLTVTFAAGTVEGAGCTLPYTASGGRITLASIPQPTQFTMLGNVDKKASEIPDFGALAGAPTGAVPSTVPKPVLDPVAPAGPEIRSLEEFVRNLPATIELVRSGVINPEAVEKANAWFGENLESRPAALRLKLDELQGYKESGYVFKVLAREQPLLHRGLTLPTRVTALFRADRAAPLPKLTKGGDLPLRGTVKTVQLEGRGRGLALAITLAEAQTP